VNNNIQSTNTFRGESLNTPKPTQASQNANQTNSLQGRPNSNIYDFTTSLLALSLPGAALLGETVEERKQNFNNAMATIEREAQEANQMVQANAQTNQMLKSLVDIVGKTAKTLNGIMGPGGQGQGGQGPGGQGQ
jgi:hypothetical protein